MDLRSGECDVVSLTDLHCSVNGSVCFVCWVLDSVCYFVVECDGVVQWGRRFSIG